MDYGVICPCLRVKDLEASKRFYEALGMEVIDEVAGLRVVLKKGHFRLALMTFLEENSLNFREADVFDVHADASTKLPEVEGQPVRRSAGDKNGEGDSWLTRDPDGNSIFFDTNATERSEAHRQMRIAELLADTQHQLEFYGASAELLQAFRDHVLSKQRQLATGPFTH
jgi:catechol 2,3-dioxygenase-like lactoylglutathione lyase family enzyme